MFTKAPLFLREALTFPYTYGLDFERQVLAKKGRDGAYKGVFERPPRDTRQVMEPETYLAGESVPALVVPKLDAVLKGEYKRYDFGGLGQFDVTMLLWQWFGKQTGSQLPHAWRGGYYFTYEKSRPSGRSLRAGFADALGYGGRRERVREPLRRFARETLPERGRNHASAERLRRVEDRRRPG